MLESSLLKKISSINVEDPMIAARIISKLAGKDINAIFAAIRCVCKVIQPMNVAHAIIREYLRILRARIPQWKMRDWLKVINCDAIYEPIFKLGEKDSPHTIVLFGKIHIILFATAAFALYCNKMIHDRYQATTDYQLMNYGMMRYQSEIKDLGIRFTAETCSRVTQCILPKCKAADRMLMESFIGQYCENPPNVFVSEYLRSSIDSNLSTLFHASPILNEDSVDVIHAFGALVADNNLHSFADEPDMKCAPLREPNTSASYENNDEGCTLCDHIGELQCQINESDINLPMIFCIE